MEWPNPQKKLTSSCADNVSKMVTDASLFHYSVGYVANAYFSINGKILPRYGAMPYIMIPFAMSHKIAPMLKEYLPYFFFVLRH